MMSLSEDNQFDVIEAFNSTSRYLDDLLNNDNDIFDSMVNRIYPSELHLNRANMSDTEASFLHLSISDGYCNILVLLPLIYMLSVTLRHNVGYLVTYLRLLHVLSTNKYNAQISWLFHWRRGEKKERVEEERLQAYCWKTILCPGEELASCGA